MLDRSTRPFELTPEGERFYDGCRDLVRRYEELEEEVRTLHDAEARSLVVASIYSVGLHHMSAFMQRFSAEHPRAQVRLEYLHPHRVCEVVESGDADLGIVSYPKETECAGRDPVAERADGRSSAIRSHRLSRENGGRAEGDRGRVVRRVRAGAGDSRRRSIGRWCAAHAEVNVTLEFDNIETMKRAIEIDAGVSILPEPSVRREIALGSLAKVAIVGDALVRPLGIVHRRDRALSELAKQFIGLLKADAEFART